MKRSCSSKIGENRFFLFMMDFKKFKKAIGSRFSLKILRFFIIINKNKEIKKCL